MLDIGAVTNVNISAILKYHYKIIYYCQLQADTGAISYQQLSDPREKSTIFQYHSEVQVLISFPVVADEVFTEMMEVGGERGGEGEGGQGGTGPQIYGLRAQGGYTACSYYAL